MFEMQIALRCLVLPAVCSFLGCLFYSVSESRDYWEEDEPIRGNILKSLFGATICSLGLIVPDFWGREILHTPEQWQQWRAAEPWQWMVWLVPGILCGLTIGKFVFARPANYARIAWPLTMAAAAALLWIVLPQGPEWQEKFPLVPIWIAIGMVAVAFNVLAIDGIAIQGGSRWNALVVLAHAGAVGVIVQSYASLLLWVLVCAGIALGASIVGWMRGSIAKQFQGWQLAPVLVAVEISVVGSLAAGSFYQWTTLPHWLVGIVLCLPSVVGMVQFLLLRRAGSFLCAVAAAILSGIIIGTAIYWTRLGSTDW